MKKLLFGFGRRMTIASLLGLAAPALHAQSFSIAWHKVAGGGGTSTATNGASVCSVSGTIGQPDASAAMTGGSYAVTGGFWSIVSAVQTAGAPNLSITRAGNSVIVFWPNTGNYTLQQNNTLAVTAGWTRSGYPVTTNSVTGTNSITVAPPTGNLFFRLANP